ncbi:helix-turn-helix transcriptional regulator [Actinomadura rayongensis]|uniref:Helix-turn-helix domain-containing protein n=1 Tax=Actinomadura rayongensis TaxID=1429076 RepID=A0A6I4W3D4_9ACTN|nr:helix-turn-helix domain-containing protein [Actinomadura rayongensis]MXQ63953.1 helix-turn-helix domain-containing protein [Actinomadura rayongensis]
MPLQRHAAIGNAVATRRVRLGLRQSDLAREAGVSETTIRNIEAGRIGGRPTKWPLVERALGWPPGSFETLSAGGQPPESLPPGSRGAPCDDWPDRLPRRIRDELAEHDLFDSDVVELGEGLRVVVLALETAPPAADGTGRRRRAVRWEGVRHRLRAAAAEEENLTQ